MLIPTLALVALLNEGLPPCKAGYVRLGNRVVCESQLPVAPPEQHCYRAKGIEVCIAERRRLRRDAPYTKAVQRSLIRIAPAPVNNYARPGRPVIQFDTRPTPRSIRRALEQ